MSVFSFYGTLLPIFSGFLSLLAIKVNSSAQETSFGFPSNYNLLLEGFAAVVEGPILDLPKPISRAFNAFPVPIWDPNTGNLASFNTSFTFAVQDDNTTFPGGEGFTFFLAPWKMSWGNPIPLNSYGSSLGIVNCRSAINHVVAVEFDSRINDWDPNYAHIGINVNSLISLNTTSWNMVVGALENVNINYDSTTRTLSVVVIHENGEISTLEQEIDLKAVLPSLVAAGFSATTSEMYTDGHGVYSWGFNSTLDINDPAATSDNVIKLPTRA